ncbi:MAG: hypothetical protein U1F43_21325 [Myxococcota bacterium]
MIHVNKSMPTSSTSKALDLPKKDAKQAVKGLPFDAQDEALKPPTDAGAKPLAHKPVAKTPEPEATKTPSPEATKTPEPEASKIPEEDGKKTTPEEDGEKTTPEVDSKKSTPEDDDKKPKLSKREQRAEANRKRREEQESQRDTVRKERDDKRLKNAPSRRDQEINEKAAKYEKGGRQREQRAWENKIRNEPKYPACELAAQTVITRIERVESGLKSKLKIDHLAPLRGMLKAAVDKRGDPAGLLEAIKRQERSFEGDFAKANQSPRGVVTVGLQRMEAGPHNLTEALRYTRNTVLGEAHAAVRESMAGEQWLEAEKRMPALQKAFETMKPFMAFFAKFGQRVAWTNDRELKDKSGAGVGSAGRMKLQAIERVNARYTCNLDELDKLQKWVIANYDAFVQTPLVSSMWDEVKTSNSRSEALLEQLFDAGVLNVVFAEKYTTKSDTGGGYSLEYTIPEIKGIVLHTHCGSDGVPKKDDPSSSAGASHWKTKTKKKESGASHKIERRIMMKLMGL